MYNIIFGMIAEAKIVFVLLSKFQDFPGHQDSLMFSRTSLGPETDNLIFQDFQAPWEPLAFMLW